MTHPRDASASSRSIYGCKDRKMDIIWDSLWIVYKLANASSDKCLYFAYFSLKTILQTWLIKLTDLRFYLLKKYLSWISMTGRVGLAPTRHSFAPFPLAKIVNLPQLPPYQAKISHLPLAGPHVKGVGTCTEKTGSNIGFQNMVYTFYSYFNKCLFNL